MSGDRFNYTEIALCACGNGKIIRHAYTEYDDWNRSRDGIHHTINPKFLCYYFHTEMFASQKKKLAHGTKVIEVTPDKLSGQPPHKA